MMDRKEAIKILKRTKDNSYCECDIGVALDMAIEALSAENSNAKTQNSNGEAIKWLESLKTEIGKSEHRTLWHYAEAYDMAIEALSAEQKEEDLANDIARRMATIIENEEDMRVILKNASAESTDLISRQDAIKAVEQEYRIDRGYMVDDYTYGFNQAIHYVSDIILHDLPSAEPKTGEWITQNEELKISDYQCSACGYYQDDETNYCPNCGAKMGSDTK